MAKSTKKSRDPMLAEWVAGGLGGLLVIASIGYLIFAEAAGGATAPQLEFVTQKTEQQSDGYVVEFKATNHSNFSAAKVKVRGELRSGGDVIETAETELDYLPAFSSRAAGLYFQHDPEKSDLRIFPVSYADP
jgi:uncharacterized protein (TIGR02588 family)